MRIRAGIVGLGFLGMVVSAHASIYSSMAVPGTHNDWNTTASMVLVGGAGNVWVCTQTITSASGNFKFAANGTWDDNWGGNASIARVPASASAPDWTGGNLGYAGLTPGNYRFTFNDLTLEFQMQWVGSPLPTPGFTTWAVVGDFNGWTPNATSQMTNSPGNTNLWSGFLLLETNTAFQFQPDGDASNRWGTAAATTLVPPVIDGNASGRADITLSDLTPGNFQFTLDVSNNIFTVISTQSFSIANMVVQGSFIATNNPPPNMTRIEGTTLWESDHHITNTTAVTVRFAANQNVHRWGVTNGTPAFTPLPAEGTLTKGLTNFATVGVNAPGRYRITFNHVTGNFTFRRTYTTASGINLLKNPGFEQTTQIDGGDAVDWTGWQAWPKRVADGFAPHSGNWCGAIHGQLYPEWTDYASFSQDVLVTPGRTYRASAWFKGPPEWTADYMQIKIEWRDASHLPLGGDAVANISALTTNWVRYTAEGPAPDGATYAHVVFLCSGAGSAGTMQIDDAEFRAVAGRTQDFETWGALVSFASFEPDWSITSGKVVYNIPPGRPPAGVFISQYVEGTGNNKAIEIYNGSLSNLDLAAGSYILQQFNNGSLSPSTSISLTGTLQPGETLVVGRPSTGPYTNYPPDPAITSVPNLMTNKALTFNGDDVIVLRQGGAFGSIRDRVGQVGTNATGSIWSRNTTDRTLTRKSTIWTGTLSTATSPFPLDEWEISAKDNLSGLGSHDISFTDPNEPYTPAGYSLIMNSGATLRSGELLGGIGDVTFWWRTESMSPPVTMSIATAPTQDGPWTTNSTLAGVASSNFAYYVTAINRADHPWLKIQQTDGGTNRFRIDEITVSAASAVPRLQDFNTWADPSFWVPGTYSRNSWSIENAAISPTGGMSASRAALLTPPSGAVVSPAFEGGVGEVRLWARTVESGDSARLLLQTTVDGGSNWVKQATYNVSTANTFSTWLYLPESFTQARLVFDPDYGSTEVLLDNIEIRVPALYRNQNFDGWPTKPQFASGIFDYQGWTITDCIVDTDNAYQGQVARLNTTVGNYILSPEFPNGIGPISFRTRRWAAGDNFTLQVQVSPNGTSSWTTLASVSPASTTYQQFTYFLQDTTNRFVRFYHSTGAVRVLVDDIRIGAITPRPQVIVTPGLDPAAPLIQEPTTLLADVITRYGASILSVTGTYRVGAYYAAIPVSMTPDPFGSYSSISDIPALPAGTMIRYWVTVQYAGIGAAPASTGYTTNTYTTATFTNYVATVSQGAVWINEIFYAPYGEEWVFDGYNHEFIELCGRDGIDISGWTIELAFGRDADSAANGGNPVYASYVIPTNTVFTNMTNGFSFYVLGDQELLDDGKRVDQVLTITVPTNVAPDADWLNDHIHDTLGVIRLLNQYGHPVYSLSYGGFAPSSDRIPQTQLPFRETNSISLIGSNSTYSGFTWGMSDLTIGEVNDGQTLVERTPETNIYAYAWHQQSLLITPVNTNDVPPFHMLNPYPPAHFDTWSIYYGFTNAAYPNRGGTLHHRLAGGGAWSTVNMIIREGSLDAGGHAYVFGQIPSHTFKRLQTIEYVIEVAPNRVGITNAYLGSDAGGQNLSTIYTNFASAADFPFTYYIPIADELFITNFFVTASNVVFQTDGNDPIDPLIHFAIRTATNLVTPTPEWRTNAGTVLSVTNIYGQYTFTIQGTPTNRPKLYYYIQPLWP